ncbi:MAG: hypothetical protein U0325_14740 [Polyangiales bacterium]
MSNDTPKIDGPAVHRAAVAHAGELGTAAVAHAQAVKDALHLPDAPVSPNAPPPYPAPPYPAPPYPAPPYPAAAAKPAPAPAEPTPAPAEPALAQEDPPQATLPDGTPTT